MSKRKTADKLAAKPTIAVIGAGRLGTALARALAARSYTITAMVTRRLRNAQRSVARAGAHSAQSLSSTKLDLLPPTDLIFITTPDDAIADTAARLAQLGDFHPNKQPVALHMSGALSSEELAPLRKLRFAVGSMHPLVSVSDPVIGAGSLRGAFYCVEGDRRAMNAARNIVRELEGEIFMINAADKPLYHAAAVLTSGHTVALFDLAIELLARCGLSESKARRVLLPLLRSTLENLSVKEPARALTGTFARADAATVRRHLTALAKQRTMPDAIKVYTLLGKHSLRLAARTGANKEAVREVERLLDKLKEQDKS
ncbi:MAG: DUF2520 domain-containing protein [Pyrinomonadaceae bacterium]|nr:DUF2520 domain-containing protein [Pyrinomonadaceae bacterium]